jgi:hypothetical protein
MTDYTPQNDVFSHEQIASAQNESRALRAKYATTDRADEREAITARITDLAKIAYAEAPVAYTEETGPAAEVRAAAQNRRDAIWAELHKLPEGHHRRAALVDELTNQVRIVTAPSGGRPRSQLPFDVRQAPLAAPEAPSPPAILPEVPALGGNEQWRLDALQEVQRVADAEGYGVRMPRLHTIVARGHQEHQRWTAEKLLDHWTSQYGADRAEQLKVAATDFETRLLSKVPKYRSQLEYLQQLHNPEVVEMALRTWRLWPL